MTDAPFLIPEEKYKAFNFILNPHFRSVARFLLMPSYTSLQLLATVLSTPDRTQFFCKRSARRHGEKSQFATLSLRRLQNQPGVVVPPCSRQPLHSDARGAAPAGVHTLCRGFHLWHRREAECTFCYALFGESDS